MRHAMMHGGTKNFGVTKSFDTQAIVDNNSISSINSNRQKVDTAAQHAALKPSIFKKVPGKKNQEHDDKNNQIIARLVSDRLRSVMYGWWWLKFFL